MSYHQLAEVLKAISLKDLIKTGGFGPIVFGKSTKTDVINVMGPVFDFADCGDTHIMKYGWYEFFYWAESKIVYAFQNDHLLNDCSNHHEMIEYQNDQVKIDYWFLKKNEDRTFSEVVNILIQEAIDFELKKHRYEGAIEYIETTNGVTMDFVNELSHWDHDMQQLHTQIIENRDEYLLNGIRLFKH